MEEREEMGLQFFCRVRGKREVVHGAYGRSRDNRWGGFDRTVPRVQGGRGMASKYTLRGYIITNSLSDQTAIFEAVVANGDE